VVVPLESPVTVSPGERLFLTIYNSQPRTSSVNDLTVNFFTNLGATEGSLAAHDENYGISSGYTAYVKKKAYELSLDQSLTLQTMVIRVNAATTITEGTEITVSLKTEKELKEIYTKAETEQLITHAASLKESKSNKVTEITANSTDAQYPSAKAVYTAVSGKADSADIPTKTSDLTNDSGFLTAHQDISGKENTSNKVTSVSSSSTDAQYPSALAVYNAIQTAIAELPTTEGVLYGNASN
jgi:hypothetical protein